MCICILKSGFKFSTDIIKRIQDKNQNEGFNIIHYLIIFHFYILGKKLRVKIEFIKYEVKNLEGFNLKFSLNFEI